MTENNQRLILSPTPTLLVEHSATWKTMRQWLDKTPLHDIAFAINRACIDWEHGSREPVLTNQISSLCNLETRSPLYRWAASELIRQSLLWSPVHSHGGPLATNKASLLDVWSHVHTAVAAQLEITPSGIENPGEHKIDDFLHPMLGSQYLFQRSDLWPRIGQALLMFKDAPRRRAKRDSNFPLTDFENLISNTLGTDIERFVAFIATLYEQSFQPDPTMGALTWSTQDRKTSERFGLTTHRGSFEISRTSAMTKPLSGAPGQIRSWMKEQLGLSESSKEDLLRAPNPLLRFPLIQPFQQNNDLCVAPVPSQLLEWLNEPLIHELYTAAIESKRIGSTYFSHVFEEYVGLFLDECSPDKQRWLNEDYFAR